MKSHRTDSISLFFGLAFLIIALGYLTKVYLNLNLPSMGWFIAGGLVFLGIVGAVTALVPSKQVTQVEQPVEPSFDNGQEAFDREQKALDHEQEAFDNEHEEEAGTDAERAR